MFKKKDLKGLIVKAKEDQQNRKNTQRYNTDQLISLKWMD